PGERRRLVTGELQSANNRARLRRLSIDDQKLRDFDQPVAAQVEFEVPGQFSGEPDREGNVADSPGWAKMLANTLDYERKVALDLGAPFESRHRYAITLPPAYRLESIPKDQTVTSRWGSFAVRVQARPEEPRKLEVEFRTRLDKVLIEPADFDAF